MRAGVRTRNEVNGGDLSTSLADGSAIHETGLSRCRSDCKTCPELKLNEPITSSVKSRVYRTINNTNNTINCKLQNCVFMLTCKTCFVQYIGETVTPLHKRMNIHLKGKSCCEILINHFTNICPNSSCFIQIIEILPRDGYKDGALDTEMSSFLKAHEDFWMKTIHKIILMDCVINALPMMHQ